MILDAVFFKWYTELQSPCLDFSQITNHKTIIVPPPQGGFKVASLMRF